MSTPSVSARIFSKSSNVGSVCLGSNVLGFVESTPSNVEEDESTGVAVILDDKPGFWPTDAEIKELTGGSM